MAAAPPVDAGQVEQLVDAHSAGREQLAAAATVATVAQVRAFTGWYSTADITALCEAIVARVEASQRLVASLTDAFIARLVAMLTGRTVSPVGAVHVTSLRAGITHAGVYGRLADQYRWEVADGVAPAQVLEDVVVRAETLVSTDVALAVQQQSQATMTARKVTHWRRVIHPELARSGQTCGLCVAASDRVYSSSQLMPLHSGCHCVPCPVIDGRDPGSVLNDGDLTRLYDAVGDKTDRASLQKTRFTIAPNGELGPVLVYRGQAYRDAAQAAADARSTSDASRVPQLSR